MLQSLFTRSYKESKPFYYWRKSPPGDGVTAARGYMESKYILWASEYPIQVFSATQKEDYTSFSQLCDRGHKIKYKKWCPVEEREVSWDADQKRI